MNLKLEFKWLKLMYGHGDYSIKTSVNSMNYFTDGTISDEYFVVEGYLKNKYK